ncbi:MAG: hypothetical protein ACK5TO_18195, partial [Planctomycetaceae bacterium]
GQVENLSYDPAVATNFQFVELPSVKPRCRQGDVAQRHRAPAHIRNGMLPGVPVMGRSMAHVASRTG